MGSLRVIYSGAEYEGCVLLDKVRIEKGKVTAFYKSILDGVYRLAIDSINSEMVRPEAIMLSFAFTEGFIDYEISDLVARFRDKFRKVGKGRKKASTFKLRYLWVRETKYLTPSDPEYEVSLTRSERAVFRSALQDGCPLPYPHYHMMLILDGHKATWNAVRKVMQQYVEAGVVRPGFHFSENWQSKKKEMPLISESELSDYMYRASYLAKIDTKDLTQSRFWSMSQ
jgi:hypothetical protein